jgi:uncharacterized protein (TIGR03435 family)
MLLLWPALVCAQQFEAASIKPADPGYSGHSWNADPERLTARNLSLKALITAAWDVKTYQIAGGPKWLDSDAFDIVATIEDIGEKLPRGKEADARIRMAVQNLLADRFHLVIHKETRPMTGYSLLVARNGFKLQKAEGDRGGWGMGRGKMTAQRTSMEDITSFLAFQLDRPVVDATGIQGVFNFTLEWSPNDRPDADPSDNRPSIFTAIEETLGLRLEPGKVPVQIIVIDRAEKPSEN